MKTVNDRTYSVLHRRGRPLVARSSGRKNCENKSIESNKNKNREATKRLIASRLFYLSHSIYGIVKKIYIRYYGRPKVCPYDYMRKLIISFIHYNQTQYFYSFNTPINSNEFDLPPFIVGITLFLYSSFLKFERRSKI